MLFPMLGSPPAVCDPLRRKEEASVLRRDVFCRTARQHRTHSLARRSLCPTGATAPLRASRQAEGGLAKVRAAFVLTKRVRDVGTRPSATVVRERERERVCSRHGLLRTTSKHCSDAVQTGGGATGALDVRLARCRSGHCTTHVRPRYCKSPDQ